MNTGRPYGGAASFRSQALLLRGRSGLTQHELAALVRVSERAVQKWEAGLSHPSVARVKELIALYLRRGVFTAGQEAEEAQALWAAAQPAMPFDTAWFIALRTETPSLTEGVVAPSAAAPTPHPAPVTTYPTRTPRQDWGEAPDVSAFADRRAEQDTLIRWLLEGHCQVMAILGMGGIGKTALAAHLAQELTPHVAAVCWRSLRNAPPVEDWLADAIRTLAPDTPLLPEGLEDRLRLLLEVLRGERALLVLDNLETILAPGEPVARYRAGYEGYGEVLRQLAESAHQSCLVLTSREQPPELGVLAGPEGPVRVLRLGGLGAAESAVLLQEKGVAAEAEQVAALVERYGGNPLALKVVGQSIVELFGGEVAAYLAYVTERYGAVFGGLRVLLDQQWERLSALERTLLYWLAVEREPVGVVTLLADVRPPVQRGAALEALQALQRRSLLERAGQGTALTLQPVVLEYVTERLVRALAEEIVAGAPTLLATHAVVQATAKEYVRQSQERLIAQPLLGQLVSLGGSEQRAEQRLLHLLEMWRGAPSADQEYGPGNVVNLLRLLLGQLRGLDLSHLRLSQVYLAEVTMHDASLAGAHLSDAVLAEAFDFPFAVALSADGTTLAAGISTGEVCLWRVADRTLLLAIPAHAGGVHSVALAADGQVIASGSEDGRLMVWGIENGQFQVLLEGRHVGGVLRVTLAADGQLVASCGFDGTIRLWDSGRAGADAGPLDARLLRTLPDQSSVVWALVLSGDGRLVASAHLEGTVHLWESASGRLLASLDGHRGAVLDVALSGDGRLAVTAGQDGTVQLWETSSGRRLTILEGHSGPVHRVALSADGRLVAGSSYDGTVHLWSVQDISGSVRVFGTLQGHTGGITGVALSGEGQLVASSSYDGTIRLWTTQERPGARLLATLQGRASAMLEVALAAEGQLVAGSSRDGTVRVWETASGQLLATLEGHRGGVPGVALSKDGRLLASGGEDRTVRLWSLSVPGPGHGPGHLLRILEAPTGAVRGVAVSGDGRLVAAASEDSTARLWEVASGQLLATLQGHTGGLAAVALNEDGSVLATGSYDRTIKLWDVASAGGSQARLLATLVGHSSGVWSLVLSADGSLLVSGSQDGTVRLWETASGQLLATLQGHSGGVPGVALSGDGRLLASGSQDGTVRLWTAAAATGSAGQALAVLQGHTSGVYGVALSWDGRLLASASFDGTVKLWDTGDGSYLRTLRADRRYERLDITDLSGVTAAQRAALLALGAVEHTPPERAEVR